MLTFSSVVEDDTVSVAVQPADPKEDDPCELYDTTAHGHAHPHAPVILALHVKRTPKYPEEAPSIRIEQREGDLTDEDIASLESGLLAEVGRPPCTNQSSAHLLMPDGSQFGHGTNLQPFFYLI